jgi:hypothetical protein
MRRIARLSCRWHRSSSRPCQAVDSDGGRSASRPLNGRVVTHQQRSPQCSAIELAPCPRCGARGGPAPRPRRSRHLSARRFRRSGRLGRSCRDRHARSGHQRLSGLGTDCGTRGRTRQAAVRPGLSARHPRGEADHCRHDSDAPSTEKPVRAFLRSGDAIERIACERTVSHLTSHMTSAPRGQSRSFAENEPSARSDEATARLPIEGELNR